MGATFPGGEPAAGTEVELDCTGAEGIIRG
jgi:hypothetical protein